MNNDSRTREELLAELAELKERLELLESLPPPEASRSVQLEDDLRLARTLTEAAADNLDTHAVASILAREVQTAFNARGASLYITSPDGTELQMQSVGLKPGLSSGVERALGTRIPLVRIPRTAASLYWRVLESRTTHVYRQMDEIEAVLREFGAATPDGPPKRAAAERTSVDQVIKLLGYECIVHVPLIARGRALGLLAVSSGDQYPEADVARLTSIGHQVANLLATFQAEQDWARERDRADALISTAAGFLLVLDTNGRVQAISNDGCEILGLPERSIIGRDWAESFVPERVRQSAVARISAILDGGPDEIFDGHALTARGDERVVRWRTTGVRGSGGKVTSLLATGIDLTRVMQSEQREAHARRRFRALLENSTDLTVVLDADGIFTYVSPSASEVLGFTPSEMMGTQAGTYVHPDDVMEFSDALADAASQPGVSRSNGMRVRAKDGSWKVLEGRASQQMDNPHIKGLILNLRDVTHRERMEGSIENSAARFRALIENSRELMMVLSPELGVRYASPACSRDLGYTTGALQGVSFEELVHGEDLNRGLFQRSDERGGAPIEARMRLRTNDRRWVRYDVTITELLEHPAVQGFIINATTCEPDVEEPGSA